MFRYKKSVPVSYDRQGLTYFYSKLYRVLKPRSKQRIRELCQKAGGEHAAALLDFVTTNDGTKKICARHFLSPSTLERITRRYYELFWEEWMLE